MADVPSTACVALQSDIGLDADTMALTVAKGDKRIAETMKMLLGQFGGVNGEVSVGALDGAKPSNRGGVQIIGLLERWRCIIKKIDGKDSSILVLQMLLHQPMHTAVQHIKASLTDCDVAYRSASQALVLVRKRYKLTAADKSKIAAAGVNLYVKRTNGEVPHQLISLATGTSISVSIFGCGQPKYQDIEVTPGAVICLNDVAFVREYTEGQLGSISTRAFSYNVQACNADNAKRLMEAQATATAYPPLWCWNVLPKLDAWPEGIVHSAEMEPCEDEIAAPVVSSTALTVIDDTSPVTKPVSRHAVLKMPTEPEVELNNARDFYLHFGETEGTAVLRAQEAGSLSTPTVVYTPVVSEGKDAIEYRDKDENDLVHGVVHVPVAQAHITDKSPRQSQVIVTFANMTESSEKQNHIEMLTGVHGVKMQRPVIRAFLANLHGPVLITLKDRSLHDFEDKALRNTDVFTAYVAHVSPSVLPATVPYAGLLVSHDFAMLRRVMDITRDRLTALQALGGSAYTHSMGPPTPESDVIALRLSAAYSFFGKKSNDNLLQALGATKTMAEREAVAKKVVANVRGGLASLTNHDIYAVGWFVPNHGVVAHQTELKATEAGRKELIAGNEILVSKGDLPNTWPEAYKQALATSKAYGVPEDWSLYAVRRTSTKRRADDTQSSPKRVTVEFESDDDDD